MEGYGPDGGYALQFSRKKLLSQIEKADAELDLRYELRDVYYHPDNSLETEVLARKDAFLNAFREHLAEPLHLPKTTLKNPLGKLMGGPLESFLDYLIHTTNQQVRPSHIPFTRA